MPSAPRALVQDMSDEVRQIREYSSVWPDRPRVYFRGVARALIVGIRWVSEAIEVAGGRDVFPELRSQARAGPRGRQRGGRPARPGDHPGLLVWQARGPGRDRRAGGLGVDHAVKRGEIHELDGADILSWTLLLVGLRQIHEVVQAFQARG